uniref:MGMT family protein n=1 Tax=Marinobacterium profundum TaxID=1714300 RepID=UPI001FE168AD|nr:MGMT family protein [Marinobacterium profundum]
MSLKTAMAHDGAVADVSAEPLTDAERIWQVVARIPPGRVCSYGQVAELAGLPRRARLVGRILSRLPQGSRLPWHRVVNARGELSLPQGSAGELRQRSLLETEGVCFLRGRISLALYRWDAEG